ncbi:portal protein [Microbacterium phage Dewdrop]|nr:portal protein [Microbacterium phage Leaf]QGZ17417.1 portal protein [Microbacterium phage Dewdrop]
MTPTPADLPSHSRPRVRSSLPRHFTQGNVTEGPRSEQHRRQLASTGPGARKFRENAPVPLSSLTASAKRLTSKKLKGGSFKKTTAQGWQEDAWEMYDLVGEQHFLGTTLANQASKARFYVGVLGEGDDTTDLPDPTEDTQLQGILEAVGGGPIGFAQMVQRMLVNLWVAGDGWLVGIPKKLLPDYEPVDEDEAEQIAQWDGMSVLDPDSDDELSMGDLEWRMLSVTEVSLKREGSVVLHLGEDASEKVDVNPDLLYMIRVWRPHPRRAWEADSPTRSSLPVLRELVGLTMHISAQVDSRLAGAGLLLVPASAARALKIAAGLPEDSPEDPFTDALMEAMLTPIGDRANASALVPLVVTIPDGTAQDFQYLTFAKPLDTVAQSLREESIRRLALGQDAPPELLLGTGGMNHWGAWLVRDDVVTTHIEPPLALIADALTTQYLRPMMLEMGYSKEEVQRHVVWYDTSKMIVQPNRAADALTLYDRDALSDEALREANGFDETDAPETSKMDLASQKAFIMVQENPGLMANPGLPVLVEQLRALIAGNPLPLPKKGNASQVAADPGQAPPPVDEKGRPIPATNNAPQAGGGIVREGASAARSSRDTPSSASTAGTPPKNPSVKQGPALAAEDTGTFAADSTATVSDEEYARQLPHGGWDLSDKAVWHVQVASEFSATTPEERGWYAANETWDRDSYAGAPGVLKDGSAPQCHYCDQRATDWVLFAEGMAFIPFCIDHEEQAINDAAQATPDGEPDMRNIDRQGTYNRLEKVAAAAQRVADSYDMAGVIADVDSQSDLTEAPTVVIEDQVDEKPAMRGAIVVLIPRGSDPIHNVSQDIDAHLTLAYLAQDIDEEPMPPIKELLDQAKAAAVAFTDEQVTLETDKVMPLGDAVVVALKPNDELHEIYSRVAEPGTPIGQLNEARNRYEFRPHVSLVYVDTEQDHQDPAIVAEQFEFPFDGVTFDRIGVWIGEEHYDFQLGLGDENQPPAEQRHGETQKAGYDGEAFLDTVLEHIKNPPVDVDNPDRPTLGDRIGLAAKRDRVPESATVVRPLNAAIAAAD